MASNQLGLALPLSYFPWLLRIFSTCSVPRKLTYLGFRPIPHCPRILVRYSQWGALQAVSEPRVFPSPEAQSPGGSCSWGSLLPMTPSFWPPRTTLSSRLLGCVSWHHHSSAIPLSHSHLLYQHSTHTFEGVSLLNLLSMIPTWEYHLFTDGSMTNATHQCIQIEAGSPA